MAKRYLRIRMHNLPISYYFSNAGHYSTKREDSLTFLRIFPFGMLVCSTSNYLEELPRLSIYALSFCHDVGGRLRRRWAFS